MLNFILGLLGKLIGFFLRPHASQEAVVTREAATAEVTLASHVENEDALAKAAAASVAAVNARIMRGGNHVTTDPNAAINTDPDANFRD